MHASPIYVARRLTDGAMELLAGLGRAVVVGGEEPPSQDELLAGARGAAAAVVTLTERVDQAFFDAAGHQLRAVANVAVGFDNIDVAEAGRRGVVVTNTPGVLDGATADHTMALILAISRRVVEADAFVRSRTPWVWGPRMFLGLDLSAGATLGVLGYGRVGAAVAARASAFDMRVVAHSPSRKPGTQEAGVTFVTMDELLAESDIVSVHTPLLPTTWNLIDDQALSRMKTTAFLVNMARGGVVDESALADALRGGRLAGAALDTFENEPDVNPALLDVPNLLLSPHIASAGATTRDRMCRLAVRNVQQVLAGAAALTPVPVPS